MIKESIIDLITAIAEGDTIGIEDSFNTVMSYKIADRLDSMRVDVAQGMFGSVVEESVELEEELNLEDYSVEEIEDFMMSEDFEQLDELSKATLGSYVDKSRHDLYNKQIQYRNTGDMPERKKLQDKATKRGSGISKAVGKLTKNEEYELEEADEKIARVPKSKRFIYGHKVSFHAHGKDIVGDVVSSTSTHARVSVDNPEKGDPHNWNVPHKHLTLVHDYNKAYDKAREQYNLNKQQKEEFELHEAVTASQLIANHNSSDHGGAQHFSNVDGTHHSWNYVKKNKEGTKYEVATDKGEAEGIAHKGKFLKLKK